MFWTELEEEIAALSAKAERSAVEEARLKEVTADFERISKKKEDYVAEHPEHWSCTHIIIMLRKTLGTLLAGMLGVIILLKI